MIHMKKHHILLLTFLSFALLLIVLGACVPVIKFLLLDGLRLLIG